MTTVQNRKPLRTQLERDDAANARKRAKLQSVSGLIANFAQLGMLALTVLIYFWTVLPIYQKEKLSEDVARLELQVGAHRRQLAEASRAAESLAGRKDQLVRDLTELNKRFVRATIRAEQAEQKFVRAEESFSSELSRAQTLLSFVHLYSSGLWSSCLQLDSKAGQVGAALFSCAITELNIAGASEVFSEEESGAMEAIVQTASARLGQEPSVQEVPSSTENLLTATLVRPSPDCTRAIKAATARQAESVWSPGKSLSRLKQPDGLSPQEQVDRIWDIAKGDIAGTEAVMENACASSGGDERSMQRRAIKEILVQSIELLRQSSLHPAAPSRGAGSAR
jgi:hypothetical protein